MARIFITGINGFVGSYLHKEYKDDEVFGLVRSDTHNLNFPKNVTLYTGDILDQEGIKRIIKEVRPDLVFHLAALSSPSQSLKDPVDTINNNIQGQLNILEGIRTEHLDETKVLVVSSAEVYGNVPSESLPIAENETLRPNTPYAVSKIAQDYMGYQYFASYGIKTIRVRPFNHIGPGQAPHFVVSAFARQIAMIEKEKQDKKMHVGNLETKRDFTDVRDIVRAYKLLMEKGSIGDVYNLGSGKSYKISEILDTLLAFSKDKIKVEIGENLRRKSDIMDLRCDTAKIQDETGWRAEIPLETSLKDTLDYWRDVV